MKHIPGPDFPTGGIIIGKNIIKEGYSSLNLPKGLVLAFITNKSDENPDIKYEYSDMGFWGKLVVWCVVLGVFGNLFG